MEIIKKISTQIREEINDARKYYECAKEVKENYPILASSYIELANAELGHADKLHAQVVLIINKFKSEGNQVPPTMQELYNYLHKQMIDEVEELKYKMSLFNK